MNWPTRLLVAAGVFSTGAYAYWRWDNKRKRADNLEHRKAIRKKREKREAQQSEAHAECLRPYLSINSTLAPQVRDSLGYARRFVEADKPIGLTQRMQTLAYTSATRMAAVGETEDLDRATRIILREVMRDCPWDKIAMPPDPGTDWAIAYEGVQELLELAALDMRYENYRELASGEASGSGLTCPGWNNLAPAPSEGLTPGDLVEVRIDAEDADGEVVFGESAFAQVSRVEGDIIVGVLVGPETELELGLRAPAIQGSSYHGYRQGDEVRMARRCIYSVRRKGQ